MADIVFDGTKDHPDILIVARTREICEASGQSVCSGCKICYPNASCQGCFGSLKPETRVVFHRNERFWKFRRTNIWPEKILIVETRVRLRSYRAISGKESNGAVSDRHDRTWSITRDSHTSNVYGTKHTVGYEYRIVTSDPDFRLQRPQKPLINVTLVEYFAVWMHLFTFVTITSAMYFHNRS